EEEALKYYEKFLKNYPKDQSGLYNTALIYFNKEDYKKASKYFFESFRQVQDKENITSLTKCYIKMENLSKITDLVEYIFNSDCKNDCAFEVAQIIEQGYAIKNPELLDFALEIYMKLFEEDPKYFDATLAIAIVYAKKGDWSNAIEYCSKALELNPKSFEANNQMGLTYYCAEEMDSCLYYYEKAFKINPKTDYRIYSNLAYAYEKVGRIEDAINMFKELITKFPSFPSKEEVKNHAKLLIEQNR
ncbi:tetratricopeptide repeat protein, partial [bacterium]|nr:tetratricopeptide repeat protein [bacterium]